MPLKITLELSEDDLAYFANVMESVWKKSSKRPEQELLDGARKRLAQAHKSKAPEYVTKRLDDIGVLIDMLGDAEWPLEQDERHRVVAAVGYFALSKDMISDKIPGIGYLDDALMADLVIRELKHDIAGYRDFCAYRENASSSRSKKMNRTEWLADKRRQIFDRIRRRREQMWRLAGQEGPTHPILRYRY